MGEDDDDRAGHRTAREVVQQAQRGLVRLVDVVHHEQHTVARRGDPQQLRGRDEQALVRTLP